MIYIQSDKERKLPNCFDSACALYGAMDRNLDYRLTSFEEVASGKFDSLIRQHLFVGSVEFMREVFNRIGLTDVRLPLNSNREYEIITLAEAHERVKGGEKVFIKPIEIKLFTGFVLDEAEYTSISSIPLETKVMAYKPFDSSLESEWRIYVHKNEIVDSRNYSGEFFINPDYEYVKSIIKNNKELFPCAYTIDVGILKTGENVVVEYNDMWAIGNYGVPNGIYIRLLRDRYFEIVKP